MSSVRRAASAPVPCDSVSIDDVAAAAGAATDLLRSTRVSGSARPGCPSVTPSPADPQQAGLSRQLPHGTHGVWRAAHVRHQNCSKTRA
jgi:hypothetical protein